MCGKKREEQQLDKDDMQRFIPWRNMMARKNYNLILKSQEYKEIREKLEERYHNNAEEIDSLIEAIQKLFKEQNEEAEAHEQRGNDEEQEERSIPLVEDPERSNTKGRSKRIKGHFEKGKQPNMKRTKAMTAAAEGREFGTITPIQKPTLI